MTDTMTDLAPPRFDLYDVTSEAEFAEAFPVLKQLAAIESPETADSLTLAKSWAQYEKAIAHDYTLYVAKTTTEVIGAVGLRICEDPLNTGKPWGLINNLVVEEDYRGLGIGMDILERVELVAKKKKCETVALWSLTSNKKNKSFYETAGYSATSHFMIKDIT